MPRKSRRRRQKRSPEKAKILRQLQERTPWDWYREIKKIRTPSVRSYVAGIVWFSYIADRFTGYESRNLLDAWRYQWNFEMHVSPIILSRALIKIGWPPAEAIAWAMIGEE